MARVHKLYNIFCFFHILFTLSISSHDHVVNGVPDILQDFDEDWAIFSTKTDELYASSVVVTRGRHFESFFSSARRRRFHQVRVTYYTNSSATFNLDYLLTCGDVQANPGPCRNIKERPCSNHRTSKNILHCMSLNARSICSKLNEFQ